MNVNHHLARSAKLPKGLYIYIFYTYNIYMSRLCYDVSVHLSVRLSVCDGSEMVHYWANSMGP